MLEVEIRKCWCWRKVQLHSCRCNLNTRMADLGKWNLSNLEVFLYVSTQTFKKVCLEEGKNLCVLCLSACALYVMLQDCSNSFRTENFGLVKWLDFLLCSGYWGEWKWHMMLAKFIIQGGSSYRLVLHFGAEGSCLRHYEGISSFFPSNMTGQLY